MNASPGQAMKCKTPCVRFKTKKRYNCKICSYSCIRPSELSMHLLVHSREKPFSCKECEERFTQASSLKRHHLRVHVKEKGFHCGECDYVGATKDNLAAHVIIHREDKPFSCAECKRAFATASTLKKHQSVAHSTERRYKCSLCDYACSWPSTLKTHQLVHTKRKTFKCPECRKWFSRQSHLVRHNLSHHAINKQLKYPHCKYSCTVKEKIKTHLMRHTAMKNKYIECNTGFAIPDCLKTNTRNVPVKGKRYKCSLSNFDNYSKSDLKKHEQSHEADKSFEVLSGKHELPDRVDEEEFKCVICKSSFESKLRLKVHNLQHTGSAPFMCATCGSTFRVKKNLKKHIVKLHQN